MKRVLMMMLLSVWAGAVFSQGIHFFAGGGLMNYQGDLQSKKITLNQSHPYISIGAYYEISDKLFARVGLVGGKVSSDDRYSKFNYDRNLSFASQVVEVQLGLEYDLLNNYEHALAPYIMAGVAGYHFNPYAMDVNNRKVFLQPLGTEGQGIGGTGKYKLTQLNVQMGGGVKFALNDDIHIRLEAVIRKLFTDYLDDVSTVYADKTALLNANGQQAVDMAFRADELNPGLAYPVAGTKRGNPKSKDFYYTGGVSVSFRLQGNPNRGKQGRNKTGCPVNVY